MRVVALAAAVMLLPAIAFADETVAGNWRANLGQGVRIDMQVSPDGKWQSETWQHGRKVREMTGTYTQTPPSGGHPGRLVFTPTSASSGAEEVEKDTYRLTHNGEELNLTSGGDTMHFKKLP
jgi:hypothetical protein